MLTVLLHSNVGEIAAVVTRYYGGIKLGTGGLVKAYGGAVQAALETLPLAERVDYVAATLWCLMYPIAAGGGMELANERGTALATAMATRCFAAIEDLGAARLLDELGV